MRTSEMLTASSGDANPSPPPPSQPHPSVSATAAVAAAGAGGGGAGATNFPLVTALLAFAVAQLINLLAIWFKEKRWDSRRFLSSGGILSSLSATVASLAVATGLQEGAESSSFALALVFAAVVMYDASGIRWHTGRQAALLNQIVSDFPTEHPISSFRPLREPLGHTPLQVFVGALVGCAVSFLMGKSV